MKYILVVALLLVGCSREETFYIVNQNVVANGVYGLSPCLYNRLASESNNTTIYSQSYISFADNHTGLNSTYLSDDAQCTNVLQQASFPFKWEIVEKRGSMSVYYMDQSAANSPDVYVGLVVTQDGVYFNPDTAVSFTNPIQGVDLKTLVFMKKVK